MQWFGAAFPRKRREGAISAFAGYRYEILTFSKLGSGGASNPPPDGLYGTPPPYLATPTTSDVKTG
ncbi:hypothetical protein METY_0287 [Methylopila sp. Yamaguchi]|nr:hypothetical protein METY_0287 [Methylopila sp. Yamaguchi]